MSTIKQNRGIPVNATSSGLTGVAVISGTTNIIIYITDISASTDLNGGTLQLIKSLDNSGSVVLWQDFVGGSVSYHHAFIEPVFGSAGDTITLNVSKLTKSFANLSGFTIDRK